MSPKISDLYKLLAPETEIHIYLSQCQITLENTDTISQHMATRQNFTQLQCTLGGRAEDCLYQFTECDDKINDRLMQSSNKHAQRLASRANRVLDELFHLYEVAIDLDLMKKNDEFLRSVNKLKSEFFQMIVL